MESIVIDGNEYQVNLIDDGTLDTVVVVYDVETGQTKTFHYSTERAAEYRDAEGELDLERFVKETVGPEAAVYDWDDEPSTDYYDDLPAVYWALDEALHADD